MKKIILISVSVLVLLLITVGYMGLSQPLTPIGTLTLEEVALKGLHIQDMSIEKGLTGWYEKDDYIIYFGIKRGSVNPWSERILFEAPKYAITTIFSDNKGEAFSVTGGGTNVELPKNKGNSEIDEGRVKFKLVIEAVELLKQTKIDSKLDYEYTSLVNSRRFEN